jgi:Carboxypeptidase regulatory-like domain
MRRGGALLATVALLAGPACRMGRPLIDTSTDMTTPGTIAGNLKDGTGGPLASRIVHAVRDGTAEKYSTTTNVTGGFSIKVPPGDYHLKVELHEGERVLKEPGTVHINKSDLDANLEIVIGG